MTPQDPQRAELTFCLIKHLARQRVFSQKTFGNGPDTGRILDHIRKELLEIEQSPNDLEEWIDVVMLALDGAWRTGHTNEAVVNMLAAKLAKVELRKWPDWQTAEPGKAIEHIRDLEPAQPAGRAIALPVETLSCPWCIPGIDNCHHAAEEIRKHAAGVTKPRVNLTPGCSVWVRPPPVELLKLCREFDCALPSEFAVTVIDVEGDSASGRWPSGTVLNFKVSWVVPQPSVNVRPGDVCKLAPPWTDLTDMRRMTGNSKLPDTFFVLVESAYDDGTFHGRVHGFGFDVTFPVGWICK